MTYNGRRAPNVSEYVANLNAIHPEQDLQQDNLNFDDDLALFTNTNFYDFDLGQNADLQPSFDANTHNGDGLDMKPLDFAGDFTFSDFNFAPAQAPPYEQPSRQAPAPIITQHSVYSSSAAASPSNLETVTPTSATKRKASTASPEDDSLEDSSRAAAEEDKRRRNTAASARFRVKKKQREQALEKSAKEMSDKVAALEGKINQLETENKWLKNLVTEKNESNEDIAALWKKHNAENERKEAARNSGVGTKA